MSSLSSLPVVLSQTDTSQTLDAFHATKTCSLWGLLPTDLVHFLESHNIVCTLPEARRILGALISENAPSLEHLKKPVRRATRDAVHTMIDISTPNIVEKALDTSDGFVKYLFAFKDGKQAEAVCIPLHRPLHFSACLSSQVGCAMGCDFCATGRLGLSRHLQASEMVGMWMAIRAELRKEHGDSARLTGAVFMGQGEPFHNYDAVIQAAKILSNPCGGRIAAGAISISTVGIVPAMLRYTQERHRYRLIVSVHATDDDVRSRILPISQKYSLDDVIHAIHQHFHATKERVTIAWVLLQGVNHDTQQLEKLKTLMGDVPYKLNIIDVNDNREEGYQRLNAAELKKFLDDAQMLKQPIVRRYSGGRDAHAACGMLALQKINQVEV